MLARWCDRSPACPGSRVTDIKFCGLTRQEDARVATELGARYLGVIFAGGPRTLSAAKARGVLEARGDSLAVGVFATRDASLIARTADIAGLDVLQLHNDPDVELVSTVKREAGRPVWAVVRVRGGEPPAILTDLLKAADGVLLDARSERALGGTGATFDWSATAARLGRQPGSALLILAGGLTDENVAEAVATLSPDVVDVSSGVESAPGVKDHERMRRFALAARGAGSVIR